jgi:hypothetical protein
MRGTYAADAHGLATMVTRPTAGTTYQARYPGNPRDTASTSGTAGVRILQSSAARVSATPTAIRAGAAVRVGMRVVNAGTGHGLAGAHPQLWQKVDGGGWTYRRTLVADRNGLAVMTTRPTRAVTYQARYAGNTTYASSVSATVRIATR